MVTWMKICKGQPVAPVDAMYCTHVTTHSVCWMGGELAAQSSASFRLPNIARHWTGKGEVT